MESSEKDRERACPACGGTEARERGRKNGFTMLACAGCRTLYAARVPGQSDAQDYDGYYGPENLKVPSFIARRLDEIIATFEPYRKENRLLDVGCGAGSFLEAARRAGWHATGLEVSRTAAEHVRGLGFEVFNGELDSAGYPEGHFDVVVASEVLEHVPDPLGLARGMARVLRPGGLLWATTPHGRGVSARLLGLKWSAVCPPEHLHLFSIRSVRELLEDAGFRRVHVDTHGTNPFEIVHGLRRSSNGAGGDAAQCDGHGDFNRVESSYHLNEFLTEKPLRRMLKGFVNGVLNAGRIGDSLKIRAER